MMNEWIISSSILIAAVLLVRFLLRGKISLRLQYALWAVVLVRLLLPIQIFTSDFGAGTIAKEMDIAEPVRQVYVSANENRYEREYDEAYRQVVARYESASQSYDPIVIEQEAADLAQTSLELDLTQILYHLWFAGMVVMTSVIVSCNIHLSIQLKRRRWALDIPDSLLSVYVTEAVPTPCIFGFFQPAIYLTPEAAKDEQVRAHVLAHELTHYRHGDHIWSVLRSVCLVLHWYNPLAWVAAKVSRADAELACDEGALRKLGEGQRGDYGRTLIGLTCSAPISDLLLTATTMTGSAGSIRERIRLLMQRPRNTVLTVTAVILMITLIVGCSFAGAPETTPPATDPGVDNDMSYQGQELPIPEDPAASDFHNADDLLIFPGTEWGMTEAELLEALDIQEYGIFSGMRGIHLPNTTFCGYPVSIAFYFDQYRTTDEWGLCDVTVRFEDEAAANGVYNILYEQLGRFDIQTSGVASCVWWSDSVLKDLISPEAWDIFQNEHTTYLYDGQSKDLIAASSVAWFGDSVQGQENMVCFSSRLHLARQIEASLIPTLDVDPNVIFNSEGVLTFPGFDFFLTEEEVLAKLGLRPEQCLEYEKTSGEGMTANGFTVRHTGAFGVPIRVNFTFRSFWPDEAPVLTEVYANFENKADFEAVRKLYAQALGETDYKNTPGIEEQWICDIALQALVGKAGYDILDRCIGAGEAAMGRPASYVTWIDSSGSGSMDWHTELPVPQTDEVRALFAEDGDPWYLSALNVTFSDAFTDFDPAAYFSTLENGQTLREEEKSLLTEVYGKEVLNKPILAIDMWNMDIILETYLGADSSFMDLSDFLFCPEADSYLLVREEVPKLRIPEILSCEQLDTDQVRMIYRFPGEEQTYCATLLKGQNWKVYSNHLLLSVPLGARALTEAEVEQVRTSFAPSIYNAATGANDGNPLACFTHSMYSDIREMTKFDFLSYFPATEEGTKEELALLIEKYPDYFGDWTTDTMPLPVHRYDADALDDVMMEFAGIPFRDLPDGRWVHYLKETDSYYNYTSDFGLLGFPCSGGWVYDGGAMLYTNFQPQSSVLVLTERNGNYYIQAHLPALLTTSPSSNRMGPADASQDAAVKAVATAFLTAYGENIYLYTDNKYDHLTVLAAAPDTTVSYQGRSVPLSDFYKNIQAVHDTEANWKQVRQNQGITRHNFEASCHFDAFAYDGDTVTVTVEYAASFTYDDQPDTSSGGRDEFKLLLVRTDGGWLVAEASEIGA